jgi:hypothetical protein
MRLFIKLGTTWRWVLRQHCKNFNATRSLARFEKKFLFFEKML